MYTQLCFFYTKYHNDIMISVEKNVKTHRSMLLHSDHIFIYLRYYLLELLWWAFAPSSSALRRVWSRPGSDLAYTTYYANYCYYA